MQCDLCGNKAILNNSMIEGVIMKVCDNCRNYGSDLRVPTKRTFNQAEASEEFVIENFSQIIKTARENRNMKQEKVAKKLALKESLVHKLENGSFTPNLELARKLEKFFNIQLVENYNPEAKPDFKAKTGDYTIADMING